MSNIDKQALRERYSPKPVPECHICGKEMTIQRMSASRITYGCTGATYDDKGCHYAEGRSIADDHYEQSRVTVVDVSDPDVLALLDELEHYKSREERVTKLVLDNSTSWDALYKKLEAAEHRKVLNSLAAVARRYLPDYDEHPEIQAADELLESTAGIGVKQQEDSDDSDAGSRNQPGMVVAVHIGAGDFVKVKGQVFEVEETDFDDHDVTLWFVGGNALKCSAGCPVEVVSAPVAAGIKVKGD